MRLIVIMCKCNAEKRDFCVCDIADRLAVELGASSLEYREFDEFQKNIDELLKDWTYEGNSI